MASENVVENASSCVTDPNFAIVCSFLEKFGKLCGLVYPDFEQLQEMLENTHEGNFCLFFFVWCCYLFKWIKILHTIIWNFMLLIRVFNANIWIIASI